MARGFRKALTRLSDAERRSEHQPNRLFNPCLAHHRPGAGIECLGDKLTCTGQSGGYWIVGGRAFREPPAHLPRLTVRAADHGSSVGPPRASSVPSPPSAIGSVSATWPSSRAARAIASAASAADAVPRNLSGAAKIRIGASSSVLFRPQKWLRNFQMTGTL